MNRFEKKCFIGSATFHGLLLVVFLFGSAFLSSKKPLDMGPPVTIINAIPTDRPISSGGNPNAKPESAPPPPQTDPPKQELAKPEQIKPEKIKEPEVKPVVKDRKPDPKKDLTKDAPKPKSLVSTTVVTRSNEVLIAQQRAAAERTAAADRKYREDLARYREQQRQIAGEVGGILGSFGKSIGKAAVTEAIGPGGQAYANYGGLIGEIYKRAVYATQPQSDSDAEAVIKVVVGRSGEVRNSQWVRRTANPVLDKAVDRAMNSVRSLPPFPPESKDSERSFVITLAFQAKKVSA
jgi:TonB family protein